VLNRPNLFRAFAQAWAPLLMAIMLDLSAHCAAQLQRGESACMASPTSFHVLQRELCVLLIESWAWRGAPGGEADAAVAGDDEDGDDAALDEAAIAAPAGPPAHFQGPPAAWRARGCFVPRTPEDLELSARFLTHIVECSPTLGAHPLNLHMRLFGHLIVLWAPFGVRFRRARVLPLLRVEDTTSRTHLSREGAKIAVACTALWYASEKGGQSESSRSRATWRPPFRARNATHPYCSADRPPQACSTLRSTRCPRP